MTKLLIFGSIAVLFFMLALGAFAMDAIERRMKAVEGRLGISKPDPAIKEIARCAVITVIPPRRRFDLRGALRRLSA